MKDIVQPKLSPKSRAVSPTREEKFRKMLLENYGQKWVDKYDAMSTAIDCASDRETKLLPIREEKNGCMICSQGNTMCDRCKENIKGFIESREEEKSVGHYTIQNQPKIINTISVPKTSWKKSSTPIKPDFKRYAGEEKKECVHKRIATTEQGWEAWLCPECGNVVEFKPLPIKEEK